MEKYYKRKSKFESSPQKREGDSSKQTRTEIKEDLPADPSIQPHFKSEIGEEAGGNMLGGDNLSSWREKERFQVPVDSAQNRVWGKCQDVRDQRQQIKTNFSKQSDEARSDYWTLLSVSVDCITFILKQGFNVPDEYDGPSSEENFRQLLKLLAKYNEDLKSVVLKNGHEYLKLISPAIQKEIVSAAAFVTTSAIIRDLGSRPFSVLLDEFCDVSMEEKMTLVLRYVDSSGGVVESFLGLKNVTSISALSLKTTLEELFSTHGLSMSQLRGQGYNGASDMHGEFHDLKTLIMEENEFAYYVHCFAQQLHLVLVTVAKNCTEIYLFFKQVSNVVNVIRDSCKCRNKLGEEQVASIIQALENYEVSSGKCLHQESSLMRNCVTCWGSHYHSLANLISMYSLVIEVLEMIFEDDSEKRAEACELLDTMSSFDFVFNLHLMSSILGITNDLSLALQRKDRDIVNAMTLVRVSKQFLQEMRDGGWSSLLDQVSSFCGKHDIDVPNMDDVYIGQGRSKHRAQVTNLHHYQVELFYNVIHTQLQELNNRFNEVNMELLLCVTCLNPYDSFSAFDKLKLIQLAHYYPKDFSAVELLALSDELGTYITDMRSSSEFLSLKEISELAQKMVETQRDKIYSLVYKLITLALILPVSTAKVERAFSAMKIVKNGLRNAMGDEWMNDNLVVFIEQDVFSTVGKESVMQRFQCMETRCSQL